MTSDPLSLATARCGPAEIVAILRLLGEQPEARAAIDAWEDQNYLPVREKYARLLADLFRRHPEQMLDALRGEAPHARIWVALCLTHAPKIQAIPVLKAALALEAREPERRALTAALAACRALADQAAGAA